MKATIKYIFIYIALTIAGFFLLAGICKLAAMCIPGYTFVPSDIMENSLLYTIAIVIGSQLSVMYVFWKRKYASYSFKFNYQFGENFSSKKLYLWAAVAAVGCFIFDTMLLQVFPIIDDWNIAIFGNPEPDTEFSFIDLISGCILAPLAEEAVFRGAIERRLLEKKWNPWYAIIISAVLFAAFHLNLYTFFSAFAILVGWVYYRTRSIWPGILIHATFNTIAFDVDSSLSLGISIPLLLVGATILYFSVKQIAAITRDRTPITLPEPTAEPQ